MLKPKRHIFSERKKKGGNLKCCPRPLRALSNHGARRQLIGSRFGAGVALGMCIPSPTTTDSYERSTSYHSTEVQ
jgi:hypothetical protein